MTSRASLVIAPVVVARGSIVLPGSKSVSIRALLLSALALGSTRLEGLLDADDTRIMQAALAALGVPMRSDGAALVVDGAARFPAQSADLFVGNSGLSIRTLTAALAFCGGTYRLAGVTRMHERPIGDLVDALNAIGADIRHEAAPGFPPIKIHPPSAAGLDQSLTRSASLPFPFEGRSGVSDGMPSAAERKPAGGRSSEAGMGMGVPGKPQAASNPTPQILHIRGDASSQFLTGLLQAAPLLTTIHPLEIFVDGILISRPYVDLTLALMRRFGVAVDEPEPNRFIVAAGSRYVSPGSFVVEGDASSASYFLALGALARGPVRVVGMGRTSLQGDARFVDALAAMGAAIVQGDDWTEAGAPERNYANAEHPNARLASIDADFNAIPDAAMTIAVLALFANGTSTLRNIGSWRVKETDRIAAMATELRKFGATVEAGPDFLRITPAVDRSELPDAAPVTAPIAVDTYDDHRMAMCFSLAACAGRAVRIVDPGCVAKTFPDYFEHFERLARPIG